MATSSASSRPEPAFSVVRNCIVHANGNKARFGNPKELDKVVASYPTELGYKHEVKLVVSNAFVERCMAVTTKAALAVHEFIVTHSNRVPGTDP